MMIAAGTTNATVVSALGMVSEKRTYHAVPFRFRGSRLRSWVCRYPDRKGAPKGQGKEDT